MHYIKGPNNIITDTFLHLYHQDDVGKTSLGKNAVPNFYNEHNKENKAYYSLMDSSEIAEYFLTLPNEECYLNLATENTDKSPLNLENIK